METARQAVQNCWNGCILRFSELLDNWIGGQSDSWIVRQLDCWKIVGLSKLSDWLIQMETVR
jgi:hypothetical protein